MLSTRINIIILAMSIQVPAYAAVELTEQVRHNFGIHSVVAVAAQSARHWQASAQVLDTSELVKILADLKAAQASVNASSSELKRLEALHQSNNNASLKAVEVARAQAISDSGHFQVLQAQLLNTWGSGVSKLSGQLKEQLVQSITSGQQVLVRADLLNQASSMPSVSSVRMKRLSDERVINAKVLGALPQTQGQSLGSSYLLAVSLNQQIELQPGQMLTAELQDTTHTVQGIRVPKSTVVRWQGQQWVYLEHEAGHYQRVGVSIAQWAGDDVLVNKGIKAGDKVVNSGAGLLLGAELSPPDAEEQKED
jgi:hypothetical protein